MSTTGITTWAVDLKDVGAIYPFQGTEGLMAIIVLVAWIGWHIWCHRWEKEYHAKKISEYGDAKTMKDAVDAE